MRKSTKGIPVFEEVPSLYVKLNCTATGVLLMDAPPLLVRMMSDVISNRLGRPASVRRVRNRDEWYVGDPVFSFVQHGMKKGATGYRVGYYVDLTNGSVLFGMVHSPVMAQLFKRNLVFSTFESVIERTAHFRDEHYVYWSSRFRRGDDFQNGAIQCASLEEFLTSLREFDAKHGFVKDLFPSIGNRGNGDGRARWAGNTFYLLLSDDLKQFSSDIKVEQLVDLSWPIFLCLYPVEALTQRTASLARNLRTAKIAKVCEFNVIKLPPTSKIAADCRGELQGAHIIPDAKGGSDRPENGLWLCEYHHRVTEGRLIGRRVGLSVDVELLSNKW